MRNKFKKILFIPLLTIPLGLLCGCDFADIPEDFSDIESGDSTRGESLKIGEEEAITNLKNLGANDGYEIVYEFQNSDTVGRSLMGRKGDTIWCLTNESLDGDYSEGFALVKDENVYHSYSYVENEGFIFEATYGEEYSESLEAVYTIGYNYWLYFGFTYDGFYKKDGTSTVCGRKCDKYVYEQSELIASYKVEYIVCVDQELGATLKIDAKATSGVEQATLKYEVKSFNTGSKVNVPSLPEPTVEGE